MFQKILVANRGEIAVRVLRACREMGIKTVAVYSEADFGALHVRMADEAYHIGPSQATKSYLHIPTIIEVAKTAGAQAIHPGYGFLAENAAFVDTCVTAGIIFVGPPAEAQRTMGEKTAARRTAHAAGVPIVPGAMTEVEDDSVYAAIAEQIGYPLLLKAAAGGGGKGIRFVRDPKDLLSSLRTARSEARSAFGDSRVFMEKAITPARHIEVQFIADKHGNVVHLGERECSIQRRHQKLIEEAPSPALDDDLSRADPIAGFVLPKQSARFQFTQGLASDTAPLSRWPKGHWGQPFGTRAGTRLPFPCRVTAQKQQPVVVESRVRIPPIVISPSTPS